ncbi:hypothetical protein WGT02_12795 [Rhizobium sp. T1470]|uniref:hypothetical protein n=1 Tax=unclassified Rhizobium TaxID=2613769 RepID=UPI001AAEFB48|nr:hypothetical protein [Rhizobium sp. T1473]MCA0802106.1 hypothetical protein [Rhizobium sp. T1473]
MKTSCDTSPIVLVAVVVAGSVALNQQDGSFDGVLRSAVLASVRAEDVLSIAGSKSEIDSAAVDHRATAATN